MFVMLFLLLTGDDAEKYLCQLIPELKDMRHLSACAFLPGFW
jgi:hypothetical protein